MLSSRVLNFARGITPNHDKFVPKGLVMSRGFASKVTITDKPGVAFANKPLSSTRKASGRPTLDDVDRISRGEAAKRRGTGSRGVPHRLNADELQAFKVSKKRHFLIMKSTGYRRDRRLGNNNPAQNTFRQYCDVYGWPAIMIEQGTGTDKPDGVLVDTSPTRDDDQQPMQEEVMRIALEMGCEMVQEKVEEDKEESELAAKMFGSRVMPDETEFEEAEAKIQEQGVVVKDLKSSGKTNQDPEVKKEVAVLLELKASLQELHDRADAAKEDQEEFEKDLLEKERLRLEAPIWQILPNNVKFHCPDGRPQARELAAALAEHFCVVTNKKGKRTN